MCTDCTSAAEPSRRALVGGLVGAGGGARPLRHSGRSLTVDGVLGSGTKSAVVSLQQAEGLTADGAVGLNTWSKLLA